ncbi:MAG TPA: cation diffusion facilitator family transporter [Ramlibacter sp.]|uniref:cation diffusion facilitator family transporter n=1 Tax=Ramlibacter sp. TaxID=1917967 RepID=UPI002D287F3D|nr:cation diffusion facilitator family transporter [Ramlibacter sp.]HZY17711.1 cation diffusion facilitator family transporter [Ramlibacter sp.]
MAESRTAVYGAIAANLAIAVTKFAVAGVTGSSAMLSEGVHSLVDTGNGALLLVGMHRSARPPSPRHPFGHGKELYFWSLIVGVLIFGLGGGVSVYEGIVHLRRPVASGDPFWNYVVLAAAAVFEGISFSIAWREFSRQRGATPVWQALRRSKDPATYTVLAEDSAALAGLAIAATGVFLSHRLDMPSLDGAASIVIGLLLAGVAVLLIRESRGLLVGEGVQPDTADAIRRILAEEAQAREVGPVLSMYIGPEDVLITTTVTVRPDMPARELAAAVQRAEERIRRQYPRICRIYVEVQPEGVATGRGAGDTAAARAPAGASTAGAASPGLPAAAVKAIRTSRRG